MAGATFQPARAKAARAARVRPQTWSLRWLLGVCVSSLKQSHSRTAARRQSGVLEASVLSSK
eukprot:573278-Alexandrium_andersonii.AAC.1